MTVFATPLFFSLQNAICHLFQHLQAVSIETVIFSIEMENVCFGKTECEIIRFDYLVRKT